MSTLVLDRRDLRLKLEGRSIAVYAGETRNGTVPLHLLERIVMRSSVWLESSLLARLADAGISILVHGGYNGSKLALVHGRSHADGARRIGQYRRHDDTDWRRRWSRLLVHGKLKGQARFLRAARQARPDLRRPLTVGLERIDAARQRLRGQPLPIESLRGIEGAAAASYFAAFTQLFADSLDFTGRNRRPPRDPVNAALSFAYTLVHFEAVRACHAAGLDPIVGYYHELDYGRDSLACDLVEPLRPRVDAWVWERFRNRDLRDEHFTRDGDACLLGKTGRQGFYRDYESLARPARRLLRRVCGKLAGTLHDLGREVRHG